MDLILQTERLLLRPLELSDTADFFAMNDNPNVNRYLRKPLDLPVIHACAVRDNVGSNAVLRKLGFEFTNEYTANGWPHNWYRFDKQNFK